MSSKKKTVKRYNIENNTWEIGYYIGSRFYIVSQVPNDSAA